MIANYQNHPIAECYPPLPPEEFEALKEHIRAYGLQIPIVLFEGKILAGVQRARACKEAGIEPYYITPEISDPIAYAVGENERRRHLTPSQLGAVAEELANLKLGSNQYQQKVGSSGEVSTSAMSHVNAAKLTGASASVVGKIRYAKTRLGKHVAQAVKEGKLTAEKAYEISHLPKEEQQVAFEEAIEPKPKVKAKRSRSKQPTRVVSPKLKWTPEEEAEDKACLEIINAPSKFPHGAPIPKSMNPSEANLRKAIIWLRAHEEKIASFKEAEVFEMQLHTNYIQAYKVNFPGFARPDGEIDQRLLDWASDLWLRQRRQDRRLELAAKLRPPRKKRQEEPLEQKAQRPFEDRFTTFWMVLEDSLGRLFKPHECLKLIRAFREEAKQFFSDLSAENRGAAVVADAQK